MFLASNKDAGKVKRGVGREDACMSQTESLVLCDLFVMLLVSTMVSEGLAAGGDWSTIHPTEMRSFRRGILLFGVKVGDQWCRPPPRISSWVSSTPSFPTTDLSLKMATSNTCLLGQMLVSVTWQRGRFRLIWERPLGAFSTNLEGVNKKTFVGPEWASADSGFCR